ncbi:predicted protein [Chaetoceros tenuissimus]|uniref:Uncharacterized protein n=1 Tax=Chaetoceros tenuissimus TaxID=426638 RepID=A0AAD3CU39_9STRA|nr:predicted protein [Chaetoceros tenuissimus]
MVVNEQGLNLLKRSKLKVSYLKKYELVADKLRCLVTTAGERRIKTKRTNLIKNLTKYHGHAPTVKDAMLYFHRLLQFHEFLEKRANDTYIYSNAELFTSGAETGGYLHPGNLKVEAIMRKYVPKWNEIRPENRRNTILPKVMMDIANAGISLFTHDARETKIVMMPREEQDDLMWKKFDGVKRKYASAKTK